MMRLVPLLLPFFSGTAAFADALSICRAGNPQFPQLCECAIERSHAAGISGTVLDKLLANDWTGVPMDVANRYGLIFVQCTGDAVAGGATALPAPGVPVPPPAPADAAPVQSLEPSAVPRVPLIASPAQPGAPMIAQRPSVAASVEPGGVADEFSIDIRSEPGRWARAVLNHSGGGQSGPGVGNGNGRSLFLSCEFGRPPKIIVGPFPAGVPSQGVQVSVHGQSGIGGRIFQKGAQAQGFNQRFLAIPVNATAFLDALRRGNEVSFDLETSGSERFGLAGSSRAITDAGRACEVGRVNPWQYGLDWNMVRHDPWRIIDA